MGEAAKVYFQLQKTVFFFLTGLKMVVGVGFCKIKVDSNFLLVLKIKCTKFHQDRSKTVDLHTKYTNKKDIQFYIIYGLKKYYFNILHKICVVTHVHETVNLRLVDTGCVQLLQRKQSVIKYLGPTLTLTTKL
jgi:hypothetical protein